MSLDIAHTTPAIDELRTSCASTQAIADAPAEIRIIRTLTEVEQVREFWCSWNRDRDCDIDFCLNFVWTRPEFLRPHVIVIYRQGRPDAMLIGRIERTKMSSRIGYFKTPEISAKLLTFPSQSLLGSATYPNCELFGISIFESLRHHECDAALLQELDTGSPMLQEALRRTGIASRDHVWQAKAHSSLRLSSSADQVWNGLSSGLRADVRRKKRKLVREFGAGAKIRCFRSPDEVEDAIPQIENIARKTYQRGLGVGFQDTQEMRRRLQFLAERGWLRIYLLTLNEEPSAFWVGTIYGGSFSSDYLGFDTKFGNYSPGTYLLSEIVEDLCRFGVSNLDFGAGESRYKERFSNSHWHEGSVYMFAPDFKGVALNAVHTFAGVIQVVAKRILQRTHLLSATKRLWRGRMVE